MTAKKLNMTDFLTGLKSIFTRNALLIIGINTINMFGNNMKNGFRTLIGTKDIGLAPAAIGAIVSVFLIAGLISTTPAGAIVDNSRSRIKAILTGALTAKAVVFYLFGVVKSQTGYIALFVADGIVWGFITCALPALLAISVDRRAMGSAYSIFSGITAIAAGLARPFGISLYNQHGAGTAAAAAAGVTIIAIVMALLLDNKKLCEGADQVKGKGGPKKKGLLAGISVKMLPLAIVASLPMILFNLESNFLQAFADETGFEYLTATAVGGSVAGVLTIVVGFLCDIMDPSLIIYSSLIGQLIGAVLMGRATSSKMLSIGVLVYYCTKYYNAPFRIIGMKALSREEQGAWSATNLFCFNVLSIVSTSILGILINQMGYAKVFTGCGLFMLAPIIGYFILQKSFLKNMSSPEE